jgi:MFS superfamily sulfate permease-like transporter
VALRIIRVGQIVAVYRQSFGEFLLIVATAAAIIVLPIEQGVAVGITLSLLHGIWSTTRARLVQFERVPDTTIWWPANPHMPGERNPDVAVVGLQAPLSFLNASHFRSDVLHVIRTSTPKPRVLVLEASGILEIDFTAAQILLDLIKQCGEDGVTVAMARLESTRAQEAFARFGIYDVMPKGCIFHSVDQAIHALAGKAEPAG